MRFSAVLNALRVAAHALAVLLAYALLLVLFKVILDA